MHRTLLRQLRRSLGVADEAAWEKLCARLEALADGGGGDEALRSLASGLASLVAQVDASYVQAERDLALRTRSLALSSAELNALNGRLQERIDEQERVFAAVRRMIDELGGQASPAGGEGLDELLAGIATLLHEHETSRVLLRRLVETLPDLVWLKDGNGVYLDCNPRFEAFFGAPRAEIVGRTDYDFVDAELAAFFRANDQRAVDNGGPTVNEEWVTFASDGHRELLETTKTPMYDDRGRLLGILGIGHDISAQRQIEDALRESEQHFRTLANTGSVMIWTSGLDKLCNYFNEPWLRFTGRSLEEELGDGWTTGVHPDDLARCIDTYVNAFERRESFLMEYRLRHADGDYRWIDDRGCPRYDSQGGFLGYIGYCNDITERKRVELALRESEQRFRSLFEQVPNISVQGYDAERRVIFWNAASEKLYGYSAAEALGRRLEDLIVPPAEHEDLRRAHRRWMDGGAPIPAGELILLRKDGSEVPVFSSHVMQRGAGSEPEMYCIDIDLSALREAEARLRLAASVFTYAREGITITDAAGTVMEINEAFSRITGYTRAEILGQNPRVLKSGRHDEVFYQHLWADLAAQGYWQGEIWNRRKSGEIYPALLTISAVHDARGQVLHYVGLFADISAQKAHEAELEFLANHDTLTGLPNRNLLHDRLAQAMAQARRRGLAVAVAYVDLDGFKGINDLHGHETGDRLLQTLAAQMKASLRESDTIARLGGDEFVAVLVDLPGNQGFQPFIERLLAVVGSEIDVDGVGLRVSASIGVTLYPQEEVVDADQLLRQADLAMYEAKLAGKNRYHVFDAEQERSTRGRHQSVARLRRALLAGEFVLHYQPKVDMRSGRLIGAEALIRWQHPELGMLLPGAFLPEIEHHALAIDVGEWVIDTALAQIGAWAADGVVVPVSVNISAQHLQRVDFAERLQALLQAHPEVEPALLELEVLETSALEDMAHVSAVMKACARMGVGFALDDFGTGYSSLTYLKRLPVKVLKIDQSFVRDMLDDPEDLAILQGVLGLAVAFGRIALAEGVESAAHGERLLQLGCTQAQGYGIARPMPAAALPGWARAWTPPPQWAAGRILDAARLELLHAAMAFRIWSRRCVDGPADEGATAESAPEALTLWQLHGEAGGGGDAVLGEALAGVAAAWRDGPGDESARARLVAAADVVLARVDALLRA